MRWLTPPPTKCDICECSLEDISPKVFIDGVTSFGPWAIMCWQCHEDYGRGLGTGRGQKFDLVTLEKVGG